MIWPSKGKPELHERGRWWVIRWYDPVAKRCRAMRTRNKAYATAMFALFEGESK